MKNKLDEYFYEALDYRFEHSAFKSQKQLGIAAKVSSSTLSEAFNRKKAGYSAQVRIADALGYKDLLDFLVLGRTLLQTEDAKEEVDTSQKLLKKTCDFLVDYRHNQNLSEHLKDPTNRKKYVQIVSSLIKGLSINNLKTVGTTISTLLYAQLTVKKDSKNMLK